MQMLESEAQDNRVVMGSLRTESVALSEQNKKLQVRKTPTSLLHKISKKWLSILLISL